MTMTSSTSMAIMFCYCCYSPVLLHFSIPSLPVTEKWRALICMKIAPRLTDSRNTREAFNRWNWSHNYLNCNDVFCTIKYLSLYSLQNYWGRSCLITTLALIFFSVWQTNSLVCEHFLPRMATVACSWAIKPHRKFQFSRFCWIGGCNGGN